MSSFFGKATAVVKTSIPDGVREDFRRKWIALGFASKSEAVRYLVEVATYGADHIESLHRDRIRAVARRMGLAGADPVTSSDQVG